MFMPYHIEEKASEIEDSRISNGYSCGFVRRNRNSVTLTIPTVSVSKLEVIIGQLHNGDSVVCEVDQSINFSD